ncbi:hypothetical protein P154DRAFT_522171 [Amniculicola lignicola CBS 123094]|uniref:F-box domain-containing protein n=1 Tax=Amniculicola lignicola CBS 123094 TaxID=1392246 RepID=A0A6A5WG74_9PLEO|nr:hypothetical protein P154DRAFT_522171 [Amniculicola lignicola CBS 123094]
MSQPRALLPYWGFPTELLILICEKADLETKASLALTSHFFLSIIGRRIFQQFDAHPPVWDLRLSRSHLLRKLQRDRPNKNLYICYQCISFHRVTDRYPYERPYAKSFKKYSTPVGFPICRSVYAQGLQEIHDSLSLPLEKHPQKHMYMGHVMSPVVLNYLITTGILGQDLFTKRKFVLRAKESLWNKYFMLPSSFLRRANLDICPHTNFGRDHVKGDGSINDSLHEYYLGQHKTYMETEMIKHHGRIDPEQWRKKKSPIFGTERKWIPKPFKGYLCKDCCLEVGIEWMGLQVEISVWQYMGRLKTGAEFDSEKKREDSDKSSFNARWLSDCRYATNTTEREGERSDERPDEFEQMSSMPFIDRVADIGGLCPGVLRREWARIPSN